MGKCIKLVDRQAAINELTELGVKLPDSELRTVARCLKAVELLPVVDAELVRHGRWIGHDGDSWRCSICGEENYYAYDLNVNRFTDNYCPRCGAKMDGGAD